MKSEKYLIVLGFILISIIWGSTWLAIKVGLESIPPFYGVAIRFTLALFLLSCFMLIRGERLPVDRNSKFVYLQLGVCSFSIPFALVYWAEQYIPSSLASILFAFYPFVVMILSHYFLHDEKINIYKIVGLISGFAGLVLIFGLDTEVNASTTYGMIAVLLSVIFQGSSLVFAKKKGHHLSPIGMNVGGMIVGLPFMFAIAFAAESFSSVHFDSKGIFSLLYLGTFGTVVTFVTYYWLLKRVQAVMLSFVSFITPILAIIFGAVFLDEILSPNIFSGAALVLAGLVFMNGKEAVRLIASGFKSQDS